MLKLLSICQLKGAPLSILAVLFDYRLRGIVARTNNIIDESGWKRNAVLAGLRKLNDNGYVVSPGSFGKRGELLWMLADDCPSLFPATPAALPALISVSEPTLFEKQTASNTRDAVGKINSVDPKNLQKPTTLFEKQTASTESETDLSIKDSISQTGWPKTKTELEAACLKTLSSGSLFPSICKKMAPGLAAEGSAYLRHILGHVAIIKSGAYKELGYKVAAAYMIDKVDTRAELPANQLPPEGLTYADALTWALNGGKTQADIEAAKLQAERDAQAQAAEDARQELVTAQLEAEQKQREAEFAAKRVAELNNPHYAIWQRVLEQLSLEMNKSTFKDWVSSTQLTTIEAEDIYVIAAPNQYVKDWLENRLAGTIMRTLTGLVGRSVTVRLIVSPT